MIKRGVYLIHFDKPYGHAQHYIGYADDIVERCRNHIDGKGARLIGVVVASGITVRPVRIWEGKDRTFERSLKRRKKSKMLCPVCNPDHWQGNASA